MDLPGELTAWKCGMGCSMRPAEPCEGNADAGVAAEPAAMMPSAIARTADVKIEVRDMSISCDWYEVVEQCDDCRFQRPPRFLGGTMQLCVAQ
jgi:hypothetical protein